MKNVVVYPMHQEEREQALQLLHNAVKTPGYVSGEMSEADIEQVSAAGIVIEVLGDVDPEPVTIPSESRGRGGLTVAVSPSLQRRMDLPGVVVRPAGPEPDSRHLVVKVDSPYLSVGQFASLEGINVHVGEWLRAGEYAVDVSLEQRETLQRLEFVKGLRSYGVADSMGVAGQEWTLEEQEAPWIGDESAPDQVYDVLIQRNGDIKQIRAWLVERGIAVQAQGRHKIRFTIGKGSLVLQALASLPSVRQVAEYLPPTLDCDRAYELIGLESAGRPGAGWPYRGAGEIIAIADSGIDARHPDFQGRIHKMIGKAGQPGDVDWNGHGTHVAGIALGDGAASNGRWKGAAPKAHLLFQAIMDAQGELTGLPLELSDLFEEAYLEGARIHNNSWSADHKSYYTGHALEVDEFISKHPDMLVIIAVGNNATASSPFNPQPGYVELLSVGSPAVAKNSLTVGASRTDRSTGGYASRTYRQFDSLRFPDAPIADETLSGDQNCLAAFSGRGPCDPRRIKPDLVAPGTDIISTRSKLAPPGNYWEVIADEPYYAYLGGTSMAAPLVAGCAAQVREYFRIEHGRDASAALVKATLVNGTRQLSGADANDGHAAVPNYHQGFGMLWMPYTLPVGDQPDFDLKFVDTQGTNGALTPGGLRRYRFRLAGAPFLRVCLAWTDSAAGAALQNHLVMMLEIPQGGTRVKLWGNQQRPSPLHLQDRDNNVHIIRVDDPEDGDYLLQVVSPHMVDPPQHFALVVAGRFDGGLDRSH